MRHIFTEDEAASFCCMSKTHFRREIAVDPGMAQKFRGKKVYRKSDLVTLIDRELTPWQQSDSVEIVGCFSGPRRQNPDRFVEWEKDVREYLSDRFPKNKRSERERLRSLSSLPASN